MSLKRECEVLVAGAGPVGLFAAVSLAQRGVDVEIVDEQFRTTSRSYALAVHPRSLELLEAAGLPAANLVARGHRCPALSFWEGSERRAEVRFSDISSRFPYLLILPQSGMEEALEARLAVRRLDVHWNHRLDDLAEDEGGVRATVQRLEKESLGYSVARTDWVVDEELKARARFVIGADGHRSIARRCLDASFEPFGPSSVLAVFEFSADGEPTDEARVALHRGTTSILWPLGGGRFRFGFELEKELVAEPSRREKSRLLVTLGDRSYNWLDPELLKRLMAERAPWFGARVREVAWSLALRFEHRLTSSFGRGRIFLAGDAAHLAAPVGVWSMNAGLAEVAGLSDKLQSTLRGGGDGGLKAWAENELAGWKALAEPALDASGAPEFVRRELPRILPCLPALGDDRVKALSQLGLK